MRHRYQAVLMASGIRGAKNYSHRLREFFGPGRQVSSQVERITPIQFEGLELSILRGDELDPEVSGNKVWKLKHNLEEAGRLKKQTLATFGGAYSNHLLAVAAAAKRQGFAAVGVVRGDEPVTNPILEKCEALGMRLIRVSRQEYRDKAGLAERLSLDQPEIYLLPEGGSNALAVKGCAEAVPRGQHFDHIVLPVGTGGTLAGFAKGTSLIDSRTKVHGIAVLKGAEFLNGMVEQLAPGLSNWKIHLGHHHGGYARTTERLKNFVEKFSEQTGIQIEPVYSGKMFFAIRELVDLGEIREGESILAVHTGGVGLQ